MLRHLSWEDMKIIPPVGQGNYNKKKESTQHHCHIHVVLFEQFL